MWYEYLCVLCLIVVPLPSDKNSFAVPLNNNDNNNILVREFEYQSNQPLVSSSLNITFMPKMLVLSNPAKQCFLCIMPCSLVHVSPIFRGNILPSFCLWSVIHTNIQQRVGRKIHCMFILNVGKILPNYTASHTKKLVSSFPVSVVLEAKMMICTNIGGVSNSSALRRSISFCVTRR
jgi:hypothetical protein